MKQLVVGDPHVTVEEMEDAEALMLLVESAAIENQVEEIVILGDLHNNFAITNVKVTGFWHGWLKRLRDHVPTLKRIWLIRGNHDMLGDGTEYPHALLAYEGLAIIVDQPITFGKALYLPYYSNPNLFLEVVAKYPDCQMIFCHQEFNGAMFDNGFYAPQGVDPKAIQVPVISGHIHTPQNLETIWYPGAPRWRTLSDANIDRAIHVIEWTDDGYRKLKEVLTGPHLKRIWSIELTEEHVPLVDPIDKDEFRFSIKGSASFVKEKEKWARTFKNARVASVITDKVIRVRESDGIEVAFRKFMAAYQPRKGTSNAVLADLALKRLSL